MRGVERWREAIKKIRSSRGRREEEEKPEGTGMGKKRRRG